MTKHLTDNPFNVNISFNVRMNRAYREFYYYYNQEIGSFSDILIKFVTDLYNNGEATIVRPNNQGYNKLIERYQHGFQKEYEMKPITLNDTRIEALKIILDHADLPVTFDDIVIMMTNYLTQQCNSNHLKADVKETLDQAAFAELEIDTKQWFYDLDADQLTER